MSVGPRSGAQPGEPADLAGWLARLEGAHPAAIELGLERVRAVGERLGVLEPAARVITVAGTNGKGSVARTLEALLRRAAGLTTALYTSPHLHRFNERLRLDGAEAADAPLAAAIARVERARAQAGVRLTYFEHTTLAAFDLFQRSGADTWILEVGLGGRLDAVNAVAPDVAVVTGIGRDHTDLLGADLAGIAREKAGIFRAGRPAVIGQPDAPAALHEAAAAIGAAVVEPGTGFATGEAGDGSWWWQGGGLRWSGLPAPQVPGAAARGNAATALAAFAQLPEAQRADSASVAAALAGARVPGRLERIPDGGLEWLLDVAHNADGAAELAEVLAALPAAGRCLAVFAVAARKDAGTVVAAVQPQVDAWYLPEPGEADMRSAAEAAEAVAAAGGRTALCGLDLAATLAAVQRDARSGDRVVVFGSFRTVAAVQTQQGWE